MEKAELAVRVYMDMIKVRLWSCSVDCFLEFVVGALRKKGKTIEAVSHCNCWRVLQKEGLWICLFWIFLREWNHIPEASVCNKTVSSFCRNLGSEEAWVFVQRLEAIGFGLDAISFGILISQSCSERKLRNAFICFSEIFARGIKLEVYAYNALFASSPT